MRIVPTILTFISKRREILLLCFICFITVWLKVNLAESYVSDNPYRYKWICSQSVDNHKLQKRYVLNKQKWLHRNLSWSFRDPFHLIKKKSHFSKVKNVIGQAFEKWADASNGALKFKDVSSTSIFSRNKGDLDILFAKYFHGDKESFDGVGGIVAHSSYPQEGMTHFDGSEYWSLNGNTGLDLRYVALHEIGHVLGLRHSNDPKAIMNPYYSEQLMGGFELGDDDIRGIQELYTPKLQSRS